MLCCVCLSKRPELVFPPTPQLQQWNDETMELLASLPLEEPSPSTALIIMARIDQCLMNMLPTHVANLTELAGTLNGKTFKKKNDTAKKR